MKDIKTSVSEVPSYMRHHYPTQKHWDYWQNLIKVEMGFRKRLDMYYKKYPKIREKESKWLDGFIAQQKIEFKNKK